MPSTQLEATSPACSQGRGKVHSPSGYPLASAACLLRRLLPLILAAHLTLPCRCATAAAWAHHRHALHHFLHLPAAPAGILWAQARPRPHP